METTHNDYLIWTIGGLSLLSLWLVGEKNRFGWLVGLAASLGYLYIDILYKFWGFVPEEIFSTVVCAINYHKWRNR